MRNLVKFKRVVRGASARVAELLTRRNVSTASIASVSFVLVSLMLMLFVATVATAQTASFGGTVLVDPTEMPLANAEIVFTDLKRSVRSDSVGNFAFVGLPYGTHAVVVRLLGYESISTDVTLTNGRPVEVDLLLKPLVTTLKMVDVKDRSTGRFAIKLAEFDERKATGAGRYLTADVFEKADGRPVSSVLMEKLPGVKAVQQNGRRWLATLRGGKTFSCSGSGCPPGTDKVPPACYMQVIVNGLVRYNGSSGQPMFDIDELDAKDIIGFEFYTTATTPSQYNGTHGAAMSSCGTVIIWTKSG